MQLVPLQINSHFLTDLIYSYCIFFEMMVEPILGRTLVCLATDNKKSHPCIGCFTNLIDKSVLNHMI